MKKNFSIFIAMLIMGVVMTTTSCDKEENFYIVSNDTIIVNIVDTTVVNVTVADSISINNNVKVEGDSIINDNHLHNSPEVEVSGGTVNGGSTTTTITNNGTGGDRGDGGGNSIDERISRVLKKSSLWAIPAEDFPNRVRCQMVTKESGENTATFQRFSPSHNEKCIAYYDGGSQGVTTLAYPFSMGSNVWSMGQFGSSTDKQRTIYALRISDGVASIGHWGYGEKLTVVQQFLFILEEEFILCGLPACDGNNPNSQEAFDAESQRTGRTLLGANAEGTTVYLFIAEEATVSEAYDAFAFLGFCPPSRMMAVSGGSSSLGLREVPVTAAVDADEEIDLEKFVLPE